MARGKRKVKSTVSKRSENAGFQVPATVEDTNKAQGDIPPATGGEILSGTATAAQGGASGVINPDQGHAHMSDANDLAEAGDSEYIWTSQREDHLIDLFRDCTFLYNKKIPAFQERHKKDKAYARMAEVLGVTGKAPGEPVHLIIKYRLYEYLTKKY